MYTNSTGVVQKIRFRSKNLIRDELMSNRTIIATLVTLLTSGSLIPAVAAGPYVIGGPATSLAPTSGAWAFDAANFVAYRAALTNSANFGPTGTVKVTVSPTVLTTINAGTLSTLNAFISPWWDNGDSSAYNQLVVNFFKGGGNLILLDDSVQQDGVAALLGIPTLGQADCSPENGAAPLFNGLFGIATNVIQNAEIGYLASSSATATAITSRGGTVCGVNGSGQVTAACWLPGAYAAGAGAMIIVADVDTWTTQALYTPLNSNGIFALNGTAFIVTNVASSIPATATVPTLSDLGLVVLVVLLISVGMIMIARGKRPATSA